jgi:uncharacterized protein YjbJ (UPF0337 family)
MRRPAATGSDDHTGEIDMIDTDRITGAARELGGKVQGGIGDFVGSDRDSLEGRMREAQGRGEALYGQAKDAVRHATGEVADLAEDVYAQAGDSVRQGRNAVSRQVEEAPLASLLIAGLVGYGLAVLIHGRR